MSCTEAVCVEINGRWCATKRRFLPSWSTWPMRFQRTLCGGHVEAPLRFERRDPTCIVCTTELEKRDRCKPALLRAEWCARHNAAMKFCRAVAVTDDLIERVSDAIVCKRGCSDADGFNPKNCDCGATETRNEIETLLRRLR